jgi:type I restriction enzyme S subunit
MGNWKEMPIGDLFTLEKGVLQSTKCIPGEFVFITASNDWKTHNTYTHDCDALIYAVAAAGSLGRCHYFSGKFISSDLCFILQAKDKKMHPINFKFYQNLFKFLKDDIAKYTKAGTSKESISQKRFSEYRIPYFDIHYQIIWEKKLDVINKSIGLVSHELFIQEDAFVKLRRVILQEAVEGKLTADWRKENPVCSGDPEHDGATLLAKIKAQKRKLIEQGKIRKEKPLAPVKPEEVPFALPEGWVWTRLGEILLNPPRNGYSPKGVNYKTGIKTLKLGATTWGKFNANEFKYVDEKIPDDSVFWLNPNDILIQRSNSIEYVGVSAIFTGSANEFIYPDLMMKLEVINPLSIPFFHRAISSPFNRLYFRNNAKGAQKSMPKITQGIVSNAFVPCPPLAEQRAIVERINKLFAMVDSMETQVKERKTQAKGLMRAVLREAFEGENDK